MTNACLSQWTDGSPTPSSTQREPELVLAIQDAGRLLNNERRHHVVDLLRGRSSVSVSELAKQIAAIENDISVSRVSRQQKKRCYTSLYQTHLEWLDDVGIVEWDQDHCMVRPGPVFEVAVQVLETVRSHANGGENE